MLVYIIYLVLAPLLWALLIVVSLFQFKIRKNYYSFYSRLQIIKKHLKDSNNKKKILLFHAASAGEYEQLKPLLRLVNKDKYFIIQSFTSPTIYEQEKKSSLFDIGCYHPFDLPWLSFYFFLSLKPNKYIITRHDVWPGHIIIAKFLKISIYYINANIHKNSIWMKWYCKSLSKYIFKKITKIIVPSEEIANNLYQIKIPKASITICHDSRFTEVKYRKEKKKNTQLLSQIFNNFNTTLFGSIDIQDEKIIFKSLKNIYPEGQDSLIRKKHCLIFVPHEVDKETINRLINQLDRLSFKYCSYSEYLKNSTNEQVIIIDSVGLLADLYRYANKAYIGGGFSRGVHSVLEPAVYDCSIAHGPNIEMLDEAKFLVKNNYSKIISNSQDLNNFLSSQKADKIHNLFHNHNSKEILDHILL